MDGYVTIVSEEYFPNWNCHRIKLELIRPIGQNEELTPAEEFAGIIVDTGIHYNIPLTAHVTMSSMDINGRSLWVNTYNQQPLLLGDLYNRHKLNTLDATFEALVQSNAYATLEFGIGTKIVLNFYVVPEDIRDQYRVIWDR